MHENKVSRREKRLLLYKTKHGLQYYKVYPNSRKNLYDSLLRMVIFIILNLTPAGATSSFSLPLPQCALRARAI